MIYVTHINQSCLEFIHILALGRAEIMPAYQYTSAIGHTYESCHTYEWVMPHIWMSHATQMFESCQTYEWVMQHIWMSHATHMNESCHVHEYIISQIFCERERSDHVRPRMEKLHSGCPRTGRLRLGLAGGRSTITEITEIFQSPIDCP